MEKLNILDGAGLKIIERAINTYGTASQLDMCIEEMSELTKEICKQKRQYENKKEIIGEIADVYITVEQLRTMLNVSDEEIKNAIQFKLARLENELNSFSEKNGLIAE